jgi:hypothetical protein
MPLQLNPPVEKEFILERSDEAFGTPDGQPTRVIIRQATQGAHERRAALFSSIVREMVQDGGDDVVRLVSRFSFEELKRIECYLTMRGCNIEYAVKEGAKPKALFPFNAKGLIAEKAFNEAWAMLPPSVASEIHSFVQEVNVDWKSDTDLGEGF